MDDLTVFEINEYQLEGGPHFSTDVILRRMPQRQGPDKWAITECGFCLDIDGDWVSQPLPDDRDEEFLDQCRFDTAEEAMGFWERGGFTSRFNNRRFAKGVL